MVFVLLRDTYKMVKNIEQVLANNKQFADPLACLWRRPWRSKSILTGGGTLQAPSERDKMPVDLSISLLDEHPAA
jgi:hypothetical protein